MHTPLQVIAYSILKHFAYWSVDVFRDGLVNGERRRDEVGGSTKKSGTNGFLFVPGGQ